MAEFTVTTIIDGDTFTVSPGWVSGNNRGDTVRPTGYNAPENGTQGYQDAKQKLSKLIQGKIVELGAAVNFDHGRIVCPVYLNGEDISQYFSEYKV